jgi:hypothetical protein
MGGKTTQTFTILGLLTLIAGCNGGGFAGEGSAPTPPATYSGLARQNVAIMVWADWPTRIQDDSIQFRLSQQLQSRLAALYTGDKKLEATAPQFINPASIVRHQREHPELDGQPITDIAPRLAIRTADGQLMRATRVIYVEVEQFQIQSPQSIMILKGHAKATLRVIDVVDGKGTKVFEDSDIEVSYPTNAPEGVVPSDTVNVLTIRDGTVGLLADYLAARFREQR